MVNEYDLAVIGAGPAGYVAAIRASQLGKKVVCIEKDKSLGGTCLNVGCIPSKALLESSELYHHTKTDGQKQGLIFKDLKPDFGAMQKRKDQVVKQLTTGVKGLFKKNKIEAINGLAKFIDSHTLLVDDDKNQTEVKAKNILIATGSYPTQLSFAPVDQKRILDSTGALALNEIPKKLVVIGGGYIGLEMGSVFQRLGSEVVVLEMADRILPLMEKDLAKELHKWLKKDGMQFELGAKVEKVKALKNEVSVQFSDSQEKQQTITASHVLVAVGRKPLTDELELDKVGIQKNKQGFIEVNENYQTNVSHVYAVGDVIGGAMLAHKGSEEGVAVAEILAGQKGSVHYGAIPGVVYTSPEVASVGLTLDEAKQKFDQAHEYKFPFLANGRALAIGQAKGFVKIVADKKTDRILGAHVIGPHASDLIGELVLAIEFSASAEDIARTCHAHPTLSEAIKEACLGLGDGSIHI